MELMIVGEQRVAEVHLRPPLHSQTLHEPPTASITRDRDRDDAGRIEMGPAPRQAPLRRLLRITLPPGILPQTPADLDFSFDRADIADLKATEAKQRAVRLALNDPEAMAMLGLHRLLTGDGGHQARWVVHAAEIGHDRRRVYPEDELRAVLVPPCAQDQPLRFDHVPSSLAAWAAW